jgi:hypothetical protein
VWGERAWFGCVVIKSGIGEFVGGACNGLKKFVKNVHKILEIENQNQ